MALGALGVTFGAGLTLSLVGVQEGLNRREAGDVIVYSGVDGATIVSAIEAQPGTARYFRTGRAEVDLAGLPGATTVVTFAGDASWGTFEVLAGRWFAEPGEAVVPTGFLDATSTQLGDTITLTSGGRTAQLRIVGEVLDLSEDGRRIITDARSLAVLTASRLTGADRYHIELRPDVDLVSSVDKLNAALRPLGAEAEVNVRQVNDLVLAMHALAAMLTALLVAVAGLGVLNTVVLDTRERVHDLGVYKALGMSPRQTVAMVLVSVGLIGALAGLLAVPAGIWLHHWVLPAMSEAAGTRILPSDLDVYHLPLLAALTAGGLMIALAGALLPAGWAARDRNCRGPAHRVVAQDSPGCRPDTPALFGPDGRTAREHRCVLDPESNTRRRVGWTPLRAGSPRR